MRNNLVKILMLFILHYSSPLWSQTLEISLDLSMATEGMTKFLILPVPMRTIHVDGMLSLYSGKASIAAKYTILNKWPALKKANYVRVLMLELPNKQSFSQGLTLRWHNNILSTEQKKANINSNLAEYADIRDAVLVAPEQSWLTQALLLHPVQTNLTVDWYLEPQKKYAHYVSNQTLLEKNGYPANKSSQWLYDRPQAIYQLFLMSGQKEWLTKANELADFYISNIDQEGVFVLKKRFDPKLLMPKGVLYRYLLTGDIAAKDTLKRMFVKSFDWDESYSLQRGFWTERNQAAALNVAVSYWELTNDPKALKRIHDIVDATVAMTFNPGNDWPLRGCPQHGFKSHEGWGDDSPACSPWMMALLGDALWRFYLLTGDDRAAALIDAFGDFILNYGLFYGDERVKNIVIPKYIVSMENPKQEELNQWTNPQHACDVAALLGKSAFIKQKNNRDNFLVKTLFNALVEQCQESYLRLKSKQKNKQEKSYWTIKPPRRFGWMYSTTSDLPWLKNMLSNVN
tara:strand:+ start:38380 stop:39924 length:1545 start_codon:yes stop_codon:yes gene_type:complete